MRATVFVLMTLLTTTTASAWDFYDQDGLDEGRFTLTETWDDTLTVTSPATWKAPVGDWLVGYNEWAVRFEGEGEYRVRFDLNDPLDRGVSSSYDWWRGGDVDIEMLLDGEPRPIGTFRAVNRREAQWVANESVEFVMQVSDHPRGARAAIKFANVPEPSTLALLAGGCLLAIDRRKGR